MTLVFPLIKSYDDNIELRYALRSMHFLNADRIIIIGHRPKWITNVEYYRFPERLGLGYKEVNIYNKLRFAASLTNQFLYCNDDHFLMPGFDPKAYYYSGTLQGLYDRTPKGIYKNTVQNTITLLGGDAKNFDIHCPILVKGLPNIALPPHGFCVKSVIAHANLYRGTPYPDLKIRSDEDIPMIKDRLFFSVGETAMTQTFFNILQSLWPCKSKYEL